jgi:hypothetical protein
MATRNGVPAASRSQPALGVRLVVYYAALALLAWALFRYAAWNPTGLLATALREVTGGGGVFRADNPFAPPTSVPAPADDPWALGTAALLATTTALLLGLPVTWLYVFTRHKKGFTQSLVHTLVLLPVIVAGVVVLVKHSLALAFSLAGVVAAVRFRNTLEDSKDAVYLFLATGIGLAAGVHVVVAIVLSMVFNLVVAALWVTDYGHVPAPLEGTSAERRLQRALTHASRTGTFVARLDDEVLKSLAPQQLEALAERAWRRRKRNSPDVETAERPAFDRLLRVRTTDAAAVPAVVEPVLAERAARWRHCGVVREDDGTSVVEYGLELQPPTTRKELLLELTDRGAPHAFTMEIR